MATPANSSLEEELKRIELETKKADLKQRKWEHIFKLAGLLTIAFGIIWPLYQYTTTLEKEREDRSARRTQEEDQKRKEVEAALREARKPFLEQQQVLYFEATTVAAKLSTLNDGPEREAARKKFYQLYWGGLSVVEDKLVEGAMVTFKRALESYEIARVNNKQASRSELEQRSLDLAHSCRDSLARGWGYDRGVEK
jgi:hypothetical protein